MRLYEGRPEEILVDDLLDDENKISMMQAALQEEDKSQEEPAAMNAGSQ